LACTREIAGSRTAAIVSASSLWLTTAHAARSAAIGLAAFVNVFGRATDSAPKEKSIAEKSEFPTSA
jgi:hypothetical protein